MNSPEVTTDDEFVLSDEEIQSKTIESPALCRFDLLDDSLALPRSPRIPPVLYNMNEENGATLNAKSLDALLHAGHNTPQTTSKADVSWSSSLATPSCTANKCHSEMNTEERKVFLPSESAQTKSATQYNESSDETEEEIFKLSNESSTPLSRLQSSTSSRLSKRLFSPRTPFSDSPMLLNSPSVVPNTIPNTIPNTMSVTPSSQYKTSLFKTNASPDIFSPNVPQSTTSEQEKFLINSPFTQSTSKVQKFSPHILENTINISNLTSPGNKTESGIYKIIPVSQMKTQEISTIITQDLDNSIKPLNNSIEINTKIDSLSTNNQLESNMQQEPEISLQLNQPKSPIIGKRRRHRRRRIRVENKTIEVSTLDTTEVSRLEKTEENSSVRLDIPSFSAIEMPEENTTEITITEKLVQSKIPEELKPTEESSVRMELVNKSKTEANTILENTEESIQDSKLEPEETTVKSPSDVDIILDLNRPKSPLLNINRAAKRRRNRKRLKLRAKINTSEIVKVEENTKIPEEKEKLDPLSQHDLELKELDQDVTNLISTIWDKNQPSTSKISEIPVEKFEFKTPISKKSHVKNKTPEIETNNPSDNSFIGYSMTQIDTAIENANKLNISKTPSPPTKLKKKIQFSKSLDNTKTIINTSLELNTMNIIQNIKEKAAKKLENKMIYPNSNIEQIKPELNATDLKQSAILLNKAVLKPRSTPITLPVNQNEAIKFSDMVQEDSVEESITDDVEMLINLLDADEALFGTESPVKSTVTSTPFVKTKLLSESPEINLSPIVPFNKDIAQDVNVPMSTTPLTRKNRPHLLHKSLVKINENRPLSTTPLTSRLKDQPLNELSIKNVGFSTASGKKLKLSEKALLKAQKIFSEEKLPQIPEDDENILPSLEPKQLFSEEKQVMIGFSTASGKFIQPSTSAIEKAKQLFETEVEDLTEVSLYVENSVDDASLMKLADEEVTTNSEDQTLVQLADNLMQSEINKTVEEICSIDDELIEQVNKLEETAIKNMSIKTEINEIVAIKSEIKEETKELQECTEMKIKEENSSQLLSLTDSETNDKLIIVTDNSQTCSQNSVSNNDCKGFQTASGKTLSISEKAIENAKKLFNNLDSIDIVKSEPITDISTPVSVMKTETVKCDITVKSPVNTIPSTVKSEPIDSFEDSEMDSLLVEFCENNESAIKLEKSNITSIQGFATASGKKLQVSEKALLVAKQKFDEVVIKESKKRLSNDFNETYTKEELQESKKTKLSPKSPEIKDKSLQKTDENEKDIISQGTMEAAEVLLELLKYGTQTQKSDQSEVKTSETKTVTEETSERNFNEEEYQGFTTASGNKIIISQEAILEAKKKYSETEVMIEAPKVLSDIKNEFQGFKTASGRKVSVSEDAILAAKRKFAETDAITEEILPAKFQGFATASGKKVDISDDAIQAAKKMFAETNAVPEEALPAKFQGFATASGKKVDISEDAIQAAKKMFAETDAKPEETLPAKFQGFATASGKKVDISEDAIQAAKKMFAETNAKPEDSLPAKFQGFATASGKKVDISDDAIQAAKKMFAETNAKPEEIQPAKFQGFATASGKKVDISEDAILSAKRMFAETNAVPEETLPAKFQGFATASGKKVDISDDAIQAAKKMFAETDAKPEEALPAKFQGFATASGKKVDISEDAILAAKRKFAETDQDNSEDLSTNNESPKQQKFGGFATASGKKVDITEEAILAARKKFLEDNDDGNSTSFKGFATASGKIVEISDNAILAAKQKFSETEVTSIENSSKFQGFATASGNKVKVSDDTILAAKKRFADSDKNQTSKFATASRNTVLISEESVLAAKRRFIESELSSETSKRKFEDLEHNEIISETSPMKEEVQPNKKILLDMTETQSTETQSSQSQKSPILTRKIRIPLKIKKSFMEAREKQRIKIQLKSKETFKPIAGKILEIRRSNQKLIKLSDIPDEDSQNIFIRSEVINVNSISAQTHRFKCLQIVTCDDGAQVIPNNSGEIGVEEIETAFLASPGVDPKLIPPGGWIKNHYRWIIWKLACTERKFPEQFINYLSIENVMAQLKFRYDREMDLAQRPTIRKITEQDSSPSSKMILCVAEINPTLEYIVLTDSWYCIKTKIDDEMLRLLRNKKIIEGTKLIIHGAEFMNKVDACHPLQQPENLILKISSNSTRRARWDARLGFCKSRSPLNITLDSVLPYGGLIGEMWCSVARVYPIMYAEHGLENGSKTVIRGERAEKTCAERYERQKHNLMERIVAEERAAMCKEKDKEVVSRRRRHSFSVGDLRDGETLCLALECDPDLHTSLTASQRDLASEYNLEEQERWSRYLEDRIRERMKSELKQRSVSMLLKLRLVPVSECEPSAILTIWRCNPDIIKLVKTENIVIRIYNCTAAGRRNGELCINTIKNTKIIDACPMELHKSVIRHITPISMLDDSNFKPMFNEVDLVGVVSSIDPIQANNLQLITLCDASGYQVIVCFWGGIDSQGLSQILIPGVSISAINLQWRKGIKKNLSSNYASLPCLQASEYSQFSRDPNENYLKIALQNLRSTLDPDITIKNLKKCLTPVVQKVQVEKTSGSKDVEKRLSALARYGEPPPISPLPIPQYPRVLVQTFHPPTSIVDADEVDSPPMSLSQ